VLSFKEKWAQCLERNDFQKDLFVSIKFELESNMDGTLSNFKFSEDYIKMLEEERSTPGCCQLF
jgi:hypothetical protein